MSELTDDQLDGLFRKSAEEFNTPFDPAAWQDMKARLDANDQIAPASGISLVATIRRWGLPIGLFVLLAGWITYRFAIPTGPITTPQSVENTSDTKRVATNLDGRFRITDRPANGETVNLKSTRAPEAAGSNSRLEPARPNRSRLENSTNTEASQQVEMRFVPDRVGGGKPSEKKERDYSTTKVQVTTRRILPQRNGIISRSFNKKRGSGMVDNESDAAVSGRLYGPKAREFMPDKQPGMNSRAYIPSNALADNENGFYASAQEQATPMQDLVALAIRPMKWTKVFPFIDRSVQVNPDTVARKSASQPAVVRGLSVRFVVAPDLSSVGLKNFARPGTNVGLLLEYRLSSHWSVQSGVIQSTKVYRADITDYALPDYALKWTVKPEGVNGRCNMIDIPVNIRYDVALRPRTNGQAPSRWFVSGGVTSYIMKREEYTYQYADPANPHIYPKNRGWSGTSGGYGFSELNLSAGYERAISRRFSWQVEPFMKVPLKRVGYLKLNLLSTGAFFSLRYKL